MDFLLYVFRFLYRIRWWLIITPLVLVLLVIWQTRNMTQTYHVDMTIYTGVVSGFTSESEGGTYNTTVINSTLDNIMNIIKSKSTLEDVSIHLYARHMIYGSREDDNEYISAENYKRLLRITPDEVLKLIDKSSEEKTVQNLRQYEKASPSNFVYGLFNWNHPFYSFVFLNNIKVQRLGNSDMLSISYSSTDPGVAYQTLLLLDKMYVKNYQLLQFGSTNSAIRYFEDELEQVGAELRMNEDSLTNYNVRNRIINYDEQTKQVAALDKEFELRYQEVLLNLNSANASVQFLEKQVEDNASYLRDNSQFLKKLEEISRLSAKISEMEMFYNDTTSSAYSYQKIQDYKENLSKLEEDFAQFSLEKSNQKYTREGYPTSNFVAQWLEELIKKEKMSAEAKVLENFKMSLDKQYSHFSPIGSTIKRQERSIDFIERSYLSILSSLNGARLRLKSLEMNSASLKMINPPIFPLKASPSKRKSIVVATYAGSLLFLLGFFLLVELLDRTLRDKLRTERITSGKVAGAFPGRLRLSRQKYAKDCREKAIQYMSNTLLNHIKVPSPTIINFISVGRGVGKSYLAEQLVGYWEAQGLRVKWLQWDADFTPFSKEFLLAQSIKDLYPGTQDDIILVEHAPLTQQSIPGTLLLEASVNLLIVRADKVWKESDQLLFKDIQERGKPVPLYLYLNKASTDVVETFTGLLPPYSPLRKMMYRYCQMALTSSDIE